MQITKAGIAVTLFVLLSVALIGVLPADKSGINFSQNNLQAHLANRDVRVKQTSRVDYYIESLCRYDREHGDTAGRSFAEYISYQFGILQSEPGLDTSRDEVRALLVALAVYFGPDSFENLAGIVRTGKTTTCKASRHVTLAGRRDLLRHFVIAAGLTALVDNELPLNFFDMKEMFDTHPGGTGFSFTDLAANRAGIKFSSYLITLPGSGKIALLSQASLQESMFFPSIKGLPEGLSEASFDRIYKSTDSEAYTAVLRDIEKRIQALPLYR